ADRWRVWTWRRSLGLRNQFCQNAAPEQNEKNRMETAMTDLPTQLYSTAAVRELDRRAIADFGIPGIVLMKRAGSAALQELLRRWPQPGQLTVFCGTGNNGGDGFIIAA